VGCGRDGGGYDPHLSLKEVCAMPVEAPEIVEVETTKVSCEGSGGALGHPKVYLEMGDENFVECPYCDRRFVLKAGAEKH
jgi:uncharacterized Zn-finger protein